MDVLPLSIPRQAGIYIRDERERAGLTRRKLAARAGVSERSIASLELGDAPGMQLDKLLSIMRALDMSLLVQCRSHDSAYSPDTRETSSSAPATQTVKRAAPRIHADPQTYEELVLGVTRDMGIEIDMRATKRLHRTKGRS